MLLSLSLLAGASPLGLLPGALPLGLLSGASSLGLPGALPLAAQPYRIIPRSQLDSLAHPAVAADAPLRFEALRIDIGTVSEDDTPSAHVFRWTNTGGEPLGLLEVSTGCNCLTAAFDRTPVPPGETGTVTLQWHPKGHPGPFQRKALVYAASDSRPVAVLELSGVVTPSLRPTHDYPQVLGPLRLKRTQVRMSGTERCIERIEVMNAGDRPLRLSADERLLPDGIVLECLPETLPAGETGDIEIRFDPARMKRPLPERLPLLLRGLPPGQNMIYVVFNDLEI